VVVGNNDSGKSTIVEIIAVPYEVKDNGNGLLIEG
jgi:predicted ATPase